MIHQQPARTIVVPVPAEVDLTSCAQLHAGLHAAFASGASVVVADFTATLFSDCASLRSLITVQQQAAALGGQLRLAIPFGSPVRRVACLIGLERRLPLYASTGEATARPPRVIDPLAALLFLGL